MRIVGIDLGAARVTAVAVDEIGNVIARSAEALSPHDLAVATRNACRAARTAESTDRAGVTIPFDADTVPSNVASAVKEEVGVSPAAVNAGQAIALAETWCGAARGFSNVVSFSISEHVTAGILIDGNPLTGAKGYAASVGWLALNPVERDDYRRHGGLEAEVAAAGVVRRLVWRIKSGDQSEVSERVNGDLSRLTADDVIAAARDGDGVCESVIRDTAKYVGMAIANVATVVDPECVVLGGRLATAGDLMLDPIRSECARRLRPAQAEGVRIVLSSLGDEAAAIGAARAALLQPR